MADLAVDVESLATHSHRDILQELLEPPDVIAILQALSQIREPAVRRAILELTRSLAP